MNFQRPHPGPLIKTDIFKPRKLKIRKVAELFHLSERYITQIVTERAALNLLTCCRLEIAFGEDAEMWALRQLQYDLDKAAGGRRKFDPDYFVPKNLPRIPPGKLLRDKIMTPNDLTIERMSDEMGVGYGLVSSMIIGKNSITLEKCLKLEELYGQNAEYWAVRQMRYDLDQKREEVKQEGIERWKPS